MTDPHGSNGDAHRSGEQRGREKSMIDRAVRHVLTYRGARVRPDELDDFLGMNPSFSESVGPALLSAQELPNHRVIVNPPLLIAAHFLLSRQHGRVLSAEEFTDGPRHGGNRLTAMSPQQQLKWIVGASATVPVKSDLPELTGDGLRDPVVSVLAAIASSPTHLNGGRPSTDGEGSDFNLGNSLVKARELGASKLEVDVALFLGGDQRDRQPEMVVVHYKGSLVSVMLCLPPGGTREQAKQRALEVLDLAGIDRTWMAEDGNQIYPQRGANVGVRSAAEALHQLANPRRFDGPRTPSNTVTEREARAFSRLHTFALALLAIRLGAGYEDVFSAMRGARVSEVDTGVPSVHGSATHREVNSALNAPGNEGLAADD